MLSLRDVPAIMRNKALYSFFFIKYIIFPINNLINRTEHKPLEVNVCFIFRSKSLSFSAYLNTPDECNLVINKSSGKRNAFNTSRIVILSPRETIRLILFDISAVMNDATYSFRRNRLLINDKLSFKYLHTVSLLLCRLLRLL